jgi:hypothetical protein
MKKVITARALLTKMKRDYPEIRILDIDSQRILINAEETVTDKHGRPAFNYWNEDYRELYYVFGVRKELHEYLERNGWYSEWVNSYTMSFAKVN